MGFNFADELPKYQSRTKDHGYLQLSNTLVSYATVAQRKIKITNVPLMCSAHP